MWGSQVERINRRRGKRKEGEENEKEGDRCSGQVSQVAASQTKQIV